ncbi:hypothetical protein [Nonomuraea angiospora]|uniref:hypothetical protein n=1 Tax=Nonomuraea angiospora TaxID=46172 RepID=UPI0029B75562|nr:hypothetical protein [Nonomuraea angiospora]MDX3100001.1 hypothetical protein [Nonomuraea angiospora]
MRAITPDRRARRRLENVSVADPLTDLLDLPALADFGARVSCRQSWLAENTPHRRRL